MINFVYKLIEYWVNKHRKGGLPSGPEFSILVKLAQINSVNKRVKKVGFEKYSYTGDELSVLKKDAALTKTASIFPKEIDHMYLMSLYNTISDQEYDIDILRENEYRRRSRSVLEKPEAEYPIAKLTGAGYKVLPTAVSNINITYIRKPVDPVWAFTEDANGRAVYDSNNSVDLELPESLTNEIALDVFKQMGFNIDGPQLSAMAENLKEKE